MKRFFIFLFLLISPLSFSLFAEETPPENNSQPYPHWFIGPIFIPNPKTPPPDHPALVVAAGAQDIYGLYDSHWKAHHSSSLWSVGPYLSFQAGFNKKLGIEFIGALSTNFCEGKNSTNVLDSLLRLGYQISLDQKESWIPDFRIFLQEIFPSGKYQKLNPHKNKTDLTGQGSFRTGIYLSSQKVFYLPHEHKLRIRGTLGYFWPSCVSVTGFNYYGGNALTKGKVYPGQYFNVDLSGEYSLSRTWTLAFEGHYIQGLKGSFVKKRGPNISRLPYAQVFVTPSIQHTFSSQFGAVLGSSFSIAGKSTTEFAALFLAFVYRF